MALFVAGSFGLAIALWLPDSAATAAAPRSPASPPEAVRPAAPTPRDPGPSPSLASGDHQPLADFCAENVTERRSFVIFRRGTCVMVDEPSQDPVGDARKRLAACDEDDARFIPEMTREGNLLVSFKEPVFLNFTPEDMRRLAPELERMAPALLTPDETAEAGDHWTPPFHARFGLLARRRMLEDAAKPVPVRIIRAKQRVTARND